MVRFVRTCMATGREGNGREERGRSPQETTATDTSLPQAFCWFFHYQGRGKGAGFLSAVGDFFDISDTVTKVEGSNVEGSLKNKGSDANGLNNVANQISIEREKVRGKNTPAPVVTVQAPKDSKPILLTTNLQLDGKTIASSVNEVNQFEDEILD